MTAPPWSSPVHRKGKPDPITAEVRDIVRRRSNSSCELCGGPGQHLHHRQLRSSGLHDPSNLVNLCLLCHRRVHGHVTWATEQGWIVSRYTLPGTVPVNLGGSRWVLLRADGSTRLVEGPASAVG